MNRDQLLAIMPSARPIVDRWIGPLGAAMARYQIDTPARQAAFLAQIAHESAELTRVVESTYYTRADRLLALFPRDFRDLADAANYTRRPESCANRIYANQNGNGPETSGDGWRFRGRGLPMITGRGNYAACSIGLFGYPSRLLTEPELLERPDYAALSGGWYWSTHGCNAMADAGDFRSITKAINGGLNGYAERIEYHSRALGALS